MIPQFFVKSRGEQINFNKFDYVPGASLVFDWGNPNSYPPAQGAGGITYNCATTALAEPNGQFQNSGGGAASMWSNAYTGSIAFNAANGLNTVFNSAFPTGAMTVVSVYKGGGDYQNGAIVGLQNNNGLNLVLNSATSTITPTIWYGASGNTQQTLSCNVTMNSAINNGWSMVTFATNGLDRYTMYLNDGTTNSVDTNTYNRGLFTPSAANIRIGKNALSNNYLNGAMISYLVYPFELSRKQIRQLWYVFRQRMTIS